MAAASLAFSRVGGSRLHRCRGAAPPACHYPPPACPAPSHRPPPVRYRTFGGVPPRRPHLRLVQTPRAVAAVPAAAHAACAASCCGRRCRPVRWITLPPPLPPPPPAAPPPSAYRFCHYSHCSSDRLPSLRWMLLVLWASPAAGVWVCSTTGKSVRGEPGSASVLFFFFSLLPPPLPPTPYPHAVVW